MRIRREGKQSPLVWWISRDPIEENDGRNIYAYVRNNPVNRVDPDGTSTFSLIWDGCKWVWKYVGKNASKGKGRGKGKGGPDKPEPSKPEPGKKPDPRHEYTTKEQRDEMNKAQPNVNNPNGSKPPEWVTKEQAQAYRDKAAEAAKNAKNDAGRNVQENRVKYWDDVIKDKSIE